MMTGEDRLMLLVEAGNHVERDGESYGSDATCSDDPLELHQNLGECITLARAMTTTALAKLETHDSSATISSADSGTEESTDSVVCDSSTDLNELADTVLCDPALIENLSKIVVLLDQGSFEPDAIPTHEDETMLSVDSSTEESTDSVLCDSSTDLNELADAVLCDPALIENLSLSTGSNLLKVHVFACFQGCSNIISIVLGLPDMINKASHGNQALICLPGKSCAENSVGQKLFCASWLMRM